MSGTEDSDDRTRDDPETDAERTEIDAERTDTTSDIDEAEGTTRAHGANAAATSDSSDGSTASDTTVGDTTVKTPTEEGSDSETATDGEDEAYATEEYATEEDVAALREDVAAFADDLDDRTITRDDLESDLRRYVRGRVRRNHARGWGPYLVLLYGTAMTIAAFYSPQFGGGWVILTMLVIWLSTLGLYTLFVIVGLVSTLLSMPGRLRDRIGEWRS